MGNKAGKGSKGAGDGAGGGASSDPDADEDIEIDRRFTHHTQPPRDGGGGTSRAKRIDVGDFQMLTVLGKGSFGKVTLVRKKDTRKLYAMKTLRKDALVKRNQVNHTKTERMILQTVQHPFLMALQFAFQNGNKLYMVLEFMVGGELFGWLRKAKRFPEDRARLYAAEILLALEHLHFFDVVYRDLKPENILMDAAGHLRLTDFGLSKEGVEGAGAEGGTTTFCGTPDYLAPEILENKGHGKAVDWWSLGILIYEMLVGRPPFYDRNTQKMYENILRAPLRFPESESVQLVGDNAKSLCRLLLQRKVGNRLGSDEEGAGNIKAHPFFDDLEFDRVLALDYTPMFIPPAQTSLEDTSNFDKTFTNLDARDSVVGSLTSTMTEKSNIDGFTYEPHVGPLSGGEQGGEQTPDDLAPIGE